MPPPPTNSADTQVDLRRLWLSIGPFRWRATLMLALVLADTVLASLGVAMVLPVFQALLEPGFNSGVLGRLLPALSDLQPHVRLQVLAGLTVLVFALKGAVSLASTVNTHSLMQRLRLHWMNCIGRLYLHGPLRAVTSRKQGELLNDWFNETLAATRFLQSYVQYLSSAALVVALVVLGLFVNWQVILVMLAAGAAMLLATRRYLFGNSARLSKVKVDLAQSITASMLESIGQVRDIKLMRAQQHRLGQLDNLGQQYKTAQMRVAVLADLPRIVGELVAVMGVMLLIVVGVMALGLSAAQMLPAVMFFFVTFYRLVSAGSVAMTSRVKAWSEFHSLELVARMVATSAGQEEADNGLPLRSLDTDITVRGLRFSYGDRDVLAGVDAVIPRARTTYLVGPSGSGKSTLLDLLMRLELPQQGIVEVNGRGAGDYRLSDWRSIFGYVSQDAALFNGSIRMNLLLARPQADDAQIEQACRLAGAHEFITALPQGYDTVVGDRGYSLSGGQRKRVAIARALIGSPRVLILDEATTSFEQSLEQELRNALRAALPELTVIVVTHRLHGLAPDDWIILLHDGRAVACGPWSEVQTRTVRLVSDDLAA
jgi:subfamily B ATP-binding cassette protein MsbA